ncbi:MAG: hypothetical protein J6X88_08165 [Bacteroidales bacterium]|nr:hypothetical protein [Bacteroidales bacterium]MBP5645092.1 hypothetical protein [Bacteroidales bacterium]
MKRLTAIIALAAVLCGTAQAQDYVVPVETWDYAEVQGINYHGYAFHEQWDVDFTVENQDGRYTPTEEDIAEAERLIQKRIAYVNRFHENQEGDCPVVDEHMRKYERQYVGFTDITGCHIVWVNFVWDESMADSLKKDIVLTEGGCGHYWHIKVNLTTGKVYGLEVNGYGTVKMIPRQKKPAHRISRPRRPQPAGKLRKTGIPHNPEEAHF